MTHGFSVDVDGGVGVIGDDFDGLFAGGGQGAGGEGDCCCQGGENLNRMVHRTVLLCIFL